MAGKNSQFDLKEKIKRFPLFPGVYLMKDSKGQVIYVGKAKNLRNRVLNYFRKSGDNRLRVPYLLARLADIDYLVTDTEKEALILENNLIKKHRPLYNIYFRDDKTFYSLRLDLKEKFPRLAFVRKTRNDGALYFGPYASGRAMKITLRFLQKLFPFRVCSDNIFRHRSRPCLYYQIGRCAAPCVGLISAEDYRKLLNQLILFLRGRKSELLDSLNRQMREEAKKLEYEKAARTFAQAQAIEETLERQKINRLPRKDQDVIALARQGGEIVLQILSIREGKMTGGRAEYFPRSFPDDQEAISSFLVQFYGGERFIPDEIILPFVPQGVEVLKEFLEEKKGGKVSITVPAKGEKKRLLELAIKNAGLALQQRSAVSRLKGILPQVQSQLGLKNLPRVVECFDISNLGGREAVGSMVVFREGRKSSDDYRRYRIRTLHQSDDYGMIFEVLCRRYERALEEGFSPDLVVVDGGKGQLNVALRVLGELGMDYPDVVALAKEKKKGNHKVRDRIFLPGQKNALFLPADSAVLRFLMQIRDEAHRFAITYHKKIRRKERLTSFLDAIPGIGPTLKNRLLTHFQSLGAIKKASVKELASVKGISPKLAKGIYKYFH